MSVGDYRTRAVVAAAEAARIVVDDSDIVKRTSGWRNLPSDHVVIGK
jgi:hypothetical protein